MSRYFEKFWVDQPMLQIAEQEALDRGEYAVEAVDPLRYEQWFSGSIELAHYTNVDDPSEACRDSARRYPGTPIQIYSAISEQGGRQSWRTWYAQDGSIEHSIQTESGQGNDHFYRLHLYDKDGKYVSYTDHLYDRDGKLLKVATFAPHGAVLNVEFDDG